MCEGKQRELTTAAQRVKKMFKPIIAKQNKLNHTQQLELVDLLRLAVWLWLRKEPRAEQTSDREKDKEQLNNSRTFSHFLRCFVRLGQRYSTCDWTTAERMEPMNDDIGLLLVHHMNRCYRSFLLATLSSSPSPPLPFISARLSHIPKNAPDRILQPLTQRTLVLSDIEIRPDDFSPLSRFLSSKQVRSLLPISPLHPMRTPRRSIGWNALS
jgi:hypothetical protein